MQTTAKALAILVLALTLATQAFAMQRRQHPALGAPVAQWGAVKFYSPHQGVQWLVWWGREAPQLFLLAGVVGAVAALALGGLWLWGAQAQTRTPVLATWATPAHLRRAKLLRKRGVVVGRLP
jgi:hypothetical protein